jgi:amino acid permease
MLKRKITAMKWNSILMIFGILSLLSTFFVKQFETFEPPKMDFEFKFANFMLQINMTLTTYGFISNLIPISSAMKNPSYPNVMKAAVMALSFCFITYALLAVLCLRLYGSDININVFVNLKNDKSTLSFVTRCTFLIILLVGLPFVFFPVKLSTLTIIWEYRYKTFSENMKI